MMKRILPLLCVLIAVTGETAAQNFSRYPIVVRPLGREINSDADDYAPCLTPDRSTLYFTTYRKADSHGETDIFTASRHGDGWTVATNAGDSFNTSENDGALAVAADGTTVVFAAEKRDGGSGDTDLLTARLANGMLTDVRALGPEINSKYWDSQPTISGDGKTIIFASNRPGGPGGTDLWIAHRDAWGKILDLSPLPRAVNTTGNECSPYLTPDGGTLYFSSDGLSGYGKYDVWMTTLDKAGWTQPVNLGPIINSDENDLFFHAPEKDKEFFLASSRRGGSGGLDVYAGTPNVFGAGMFRLTVSVVDSVSGKPLPSIVNVIDAATGQPLLSMATNTEVMEYSQLLPAHREYRVEAMIRDYPTRSADIRGTDPNTEQKVRLLFGPLTVAEFDLGRYNVPFFVTGYYRPNTRRNLDTLFDLVNGPLERASYIERFRRDSRRHQEYEAYARTVEGIFQTVYTAAIDEIFPRFLKQGLPTEVLQITVTGYADPQPIIGAYLENDPVAFVDRTGARHTATNGQRMDNLLLSGLRAWYAGRYLDELFASSSADGHTEYADLVRAGRIRYVYVGGDVSNDSANYAVQRRIHISMKRTGEQTRGTGDDFDLDEKLR